MAACVNNFSNEHNSVRKSVKNFRVVLYPSAFRVCSAVWSASHVGHAEGDWFGFGRTTGCSALVTGVPWCLCCHWCTLAGRAPPQTSVFISYTRSLSHIVDSCARDQGLGSCMSPQAAAPTRSAGFSKDAEEQRCQRLSFLKQQ